jgi:hypothetical protein
MTLEMDSKMKLKRCCIREWLNFLSASGILGFKEDVHTGMDRKENLWKLE